MLAVLMDKDGNRIAEDNALPTKLVGSLAKDGTTKNLSFETDANGEDVLRVVDAAPFAYDSTSGALKTQDVNIKPANVFKFKVSGSLPDGGVVEVWTPASGKKCILMGFALSAQTAGLWEVVELQSSGALQIQLIQLYMGANTSICVNFGNSAGRLLGAIDRKVGLRQSIWGRRRWLSQYMGS